jgi:hypothetical protein
VNPADGAPKLKLIQIVLHLRLQLFELIGGVASGVAPDAGRGDKI